MDVLVVTLHKCGHFSSAGKNRVPYGGAILRRSHHMTSCLCLAVNYSGSSCNPVKLLSLSIQNAPYTEFAHGEIKET